jgi:DNA-binding MarR family transcriptional regulator
MAPSEKLPAASTDRGTVTNPVSDPPGETASVPAPRLDPAALAVWGGFLEVHTRLMRMLDADLVATHGMALAEYEVLFKLSAAGGQLRMSDLAQVAMLSRSGLTRIVGVLEAQRLVRRVPSPGDGRVLIATLTAAGRGRLAAARETHSANVRQLFLAPLDQDQKKAIAAGWQSIRVALDQHDQAQAS